MIGNEELINLWGWLDRPGNFLLVESESGLLKLFLVANRIWAKDGFRVRDLQISTSHPVEDLASKLRDWKEKVSLVVLRRKGDGFPQEALNFLYELEQPIMVNADPPILKHQGKPIQAAGLVTPSNGIVINVFGVRTRNVANANVPIEVEVDLSNAQGLERRIGVSATTELQSASALPATAWYSLPDKIDKAVLRIDIQPDLEADHWDLSLLSPASGKLNPMYVPQETHWSRGYPSDILVVFDRTCPDERCWRQALELILGRGSLDQGDWYRPKPSETTELKQSELNFEVRQAVAEGLSKALADQNVSLEIFWFADSVEHDIALPDDVALAHPHGQMGEVNPPLTLDRLQEYFLPLTYSPGLDVWDPLEVALKEGLDMLERRAKRPVVLMIGNSPPSYPTDEKSPLCRIASALGQTSYRSQSNGWATQIERCASSDIPIIYLFLTHQSPDGREPDEISNRFYRLQNVIKEALQTDVHVISARAIKAEVPAAIAEAIRCFVTPQNPVSKVKITRVTPR